MLLIFLAPAIEAGPRNPKVTACFCYVSVRFCVIEDPLATLGFLTRRSIVTPLGLLLWKLEVSRQFVHSYTLLLF